MPAASPTPSPGTDSVRGLRVVIVDDELLERRRLRRYLAEEQKISAVIECASAAAAVAVLNREQTDLFFVDGHLPGIDALGAAYGASVCRPELVLLVREGRRPAATRGALGSECLSTPVTREPIRAALDRARRRVASADPKSQDGRAGLSRVLGRVVVRCAGRVLAVPSESIEWIEAADNYVRLHRGNDVQVVRETLAALEVRLDPLRFVRIHRSAIVNIDAVEEIHSVQGAWQVCLRSGARIPVGRSHRGHVRAMVET
jgi:two-component system, LytTR family, response regulator